MMISSTDGFLSVSLSPEAVIPPGTATDLIGHTILNSGIIRSCETQLHGSAINHDGSIFSEKVKMGNFSQVNADTGGIITSELSLSGPSGTEVAENSASAARKFKFNLQPNIHSYRMEQLSRLIFVPQSTQLF